MLLCHIETDSFVMSLGNCQGRSVSWGRFLCWAKSMTEKKNIFHVQIKGSTEEIRLVLCKRHTEETATLRGNKQKQKQSIAESLKISS